ncbi:Fur family peroxide stress response transcriptional regulator [Scopulibacillus darangshiensis]|uniref:Fur family peroxide stress response transcriptional regulator n=1 Tax=Scopulibacillus darangshiensis TaxID=442528 RepID=A0A4R2NJN7_9BACL|nr:Fur family transcriptional regulator [Scopulibacillus darangshiensis]TCP21651.1 Fur family peroxide stress response transcriptional regulator [Scopulibacillus darangshiensis]
MTEAQLREAIERLRGTGARITPQRRGILEYLVETKSHPTADEIYKKLEKKLPHMSSATVYNNLKTLKKAGLVSELTYGDHSSRFDIETSDHYHIICLDCGKIRNFRFPVLTEIEAFAETITSYKVKSHRMEVYGICPECWSG